MQIEVETYNGQTGKRKWNIVIAVSVILNRSVADSDWFWQRILTVKDK